MIIKLYGKEYKVNLTVASYSQYGNLALQLIHTDDDGYLEPFGFITKNLSNVDKFQAFLDVNNMPGIEVFVQKYKLGVPKGTMASSGYCMYPLYEFDEAVLRSYDNYGVDKYLKVNDYKKGVHNENKRNRS